MELAVFTFVCVVMLMGTQIANTASKVIKKIDSHIDKQDNPRAFLEPLSSKPLVNRSSWEGLHIVTKPTTFKAVLLFSRTGFFLVIPKFGKVKGTSNPHNKSAQLIMQSVGSSVVRFKGHHSQAYLAMDQHGVVYATKSLNDECLFKETLESSDFHTFASRKYSGLNSFNNNRELYLAIKRNGKAKHGINTSKRQRAAQFVVYPSWKMS